MKAIGFTSRFVLGLVLAESLFIAALGGAIGLLLARYLAGLDITNGLLLLYLPIPALVAGLVVALGHGPGVRPGSGGQRDAAERRHGAPEALRWRSRSSTTSAASAAAGIPRSSPCWASPARSAVLRRDAGAGSRLSGDDRLVRIGRERHHPAGRHRHRDDERPRARRRARGRGHAASGAERIRADGERGGRRDCRAAAARHRERRQRADARRLAARAPGARNVRMAEGRFFTPGLYRSSSAATPPTPMPGSTSARRSRSGRGPGPLSAGSTPAAARSTPRSGPTPTC